jgi:hypothetical protein
MPVEPTEELGMKVTKMEEIAPQAVGTLLEILTKLWDFPEVRT